MSDTLNSMSSVLDTIMSSLKAKLLPDVEVLIKAEVEKLLPLIQKMIEAELNQLFENLVAKILEDLKPASTATTVAPTA